VAERSARLDQRAATLTIEGITMASIVEGGVQAFTVVAKNKAGVVVPDTGITVTAVGGKATVGTDGSAGSFTAGPAGEATLTASDGTLTSAPVTITIVVAAVDVTPASLEIVLG
jgi:hypothetical protein